MESGFGSDFGSDFGSGGSGGGKLDPGLIMEQVKVQIAVANAQELLQVRGAAGPEPRLSGGGGGGGQRRSRPGAPSPGSAAASHGLSPQRMTDKCFRKCIGKPGGSLDNSEQKCIAMCMDRYMDSWNTVSRAYNSRLQRERANM
uniref:Mitochondrial import inner membrane translocase subunit n=7 Tax=Neognathae TaxID=8825 RepID=A0A8B9TB07_ANAPL